VHSTVDCTVFLNPKEIEGYSTAAQAEQYRRLANYLLWPDTDPQPVEFQDWPEFPKHLKPRLAAAADAKFGWKGGERTARALMCFAARQQSISITLRSITPDSDTSGGKIQSDSPFQRTRPANHVG